MIYYKIKYFLVRDFTISFFKVNSFAHDARLDITCISTALTAKQSLLTDLIWPIATAAIVAEKLTADRGFVSPKLPSNLGDL